MKPTLLIIDDEPDLVEILKDMAQRAELDVLTAFDGLQALDLLEVSATQGVPIDAILSDIKMPRITGLEMLARLRKSGSLIPVVFLTGFADREKAATARHLGAFDFLSKPVEAAPLGRTLRAAATFGFSLRTLEAELDALVEATHVPPEERAMFRESQRAVLLLKREQRARKPLAA